MNPPATRILIGDDEDTILQGLSSYLQLEGYTVDTATSAEQALTLDLTAYDLLLLDIMMDGMSGTQLASLLKADPATSRLPIIFLTAKDTVDDMVEGLNLGADDYIAKPFDVRNVIARIEAVLRRTAPARNGSPAQGVTCDRLTMTCTVDGNRVFSREELLSRIWPERTVITDRSVDVHVTRLRSKIAPYDKHIFTRSGYGYGWQD